MQLASVRTHLSRPEPTTSFSLIHRMPGATAIPQPFLNSQDPLEARQSWPGSGRAKLDMIIDLVGRSVASTLKCILYIIQGACHCGYDADGPTGSYCMIVFSSKLLVYIYTHHALTFQACSTPTEE